MLINLGYCPKCNQKVEAEFGRLKPNAIIPCPHGCDGVFVIEEADMVGILEQAAHSDPGGSL